MKWTEIVADVKYKPGYTLEVENSDSWCDYLVVKYIVEDTYNPGKQLTIVFSSPLPPEEVAFSLPEEKKLDYLCHELHKMEMHETDEWIRYKGEMIFDPHEELRRYDQ